MCACRLCQALGEATVQAQVEWGPEGPQQGRAPGHSADRQELVFGFNRPRALTHIHASQTKHHIFTLAASDELDRSP